MEELTTNELLVLIEEHLEEIKILLNNCYTYFLWIFAVFIIYQLYKFLSRFIFGGV